MRECENEEMGCTGCGKWPKRWARDGEVGQNGNNLMILDIRFDLVDYA